MFKKVRVIMRQKRKNGTSIELTFEGAVLSSSGTDKEIASMVLEAEMKGNEGKTRTYFSIK